MKNETSSIIENRQSALGRRWALRDVSDYRHVDKNKGPTPLQGSIAFSRGCKDSDLDLLLDKSLASHMPDPNILTDMKAGSDRLAKAIINGESILLFGDYDVDGATSTAIMKRYISMTGHPYVTTVVTDREHGYGFGEAALDSALENMPDVIVLLDCGTQNNDSINKANLNGADVIVVDHHKPGPVLPSALALINPHRNDEGEEGQKLRDLCTAGLAFMLAAATNRSLREKDFWANKTEPKISTLLDLVALGTVCDVMPLRGLNRAFVTNGLKRLDMRANGGLDALARVAGVKEGASVTSFGFHIGPRINAGGRIGKARLGTDLLSSDDPVFCNEIADELNVLNQDRQQIERAVQNEALTLVNPEDPIIVVCGDGWHEGVIGIVAGRIKELYNRPTVVMTKNDAGNVKGSGRSIPGIDLGTAVMNAKAEGLLDAGGGHIMACGLSTTSERVEALKAFLIEAIGKDSEAAREKATTSADAGLWTSDLTHGFHDEIEALGPYGQGWSKPRFIIGPAKASGIRVVRGGHAFFDLIDDNGSIKAKVWRAEETGLINALQKNCQILALGHIELDTFRGANDIVLIIEDIMVLDKEKIEEPVF